MPDKKARYKIKNSDGTYSTRWFETKADVVMLANGGTVENAVVKTLTHSKAGNVHALTGLSGATGKLSCIAYMTAPYVAGDTITIDAVAYTIETNNGEALSDNAWIANRDIQFTIDTTSKKINFKIGGGASVGILNSTITVNPSNPTTGVANELYVVGNVADYDNIYIDDVVRASHTQPCLIACVDDTNNGYESIVETKKVSGKNVTASYNRLPVNESDTPTWNVSITDAKNKSSIKQKRPMVMSKKNGVIDVETAYIHNGTSFDMLSQKGAYMLGTYTTAPYVRVMYNTNGTAMTAHTDLDGISAITGLNQVMAIEVSSDNKWYVIATTTANTFIYYRQGDIFNRLTTPTQITGWINSVGFSKDNTKVAFGTADGKIHVFSISGGTLTFVKTITITNAPIYNIKFTSSKLVITLGSSNTLIYTFELTNFTQTATNTVASSASQNRCLETFIDSGKEYALVLCSNNTMYLCELGASTITVSTVSGVNAASLCGLKITYDTFNIVCINNATNKLNVLKRTGTNFTFGTDVNIGTNPYFTVDINNYVYTNTKNKLRVENNQLTNLGTYTTPHPNADKLLTLAPSY